MTTLPLAVAGSPWAFGWDALVAIGTLALAGVTAGVAALTWRSVRQSGRELSAVEVQTAALVAQTDAVVEQASATNREVEFSGASLEAASRPVLVGLTLDPGVVSMDPRNPIERLVQIAFKDAIDDDHSAVADPDAVYFEATDEKLYCSVPLVNVGAGVAFIQRVDLLSEVPGSWPLGGRVTRVVVPAGESTRTLFSAVRRQSDGHVSDWEGITGIGGRGFVSFAIRVVCTGAAGGIVTVTELTSAQIPDGTFIYTQQRVWDGEGDPRRLLVSTDNIAM